LVYDARVILLAIRVRDPCRDEENLELNEKIKQELNPRKIDEPKTPYHASPRGTDDEADLLAIGAFHYPDLPT
jgi:hypothetical protein